MDGNPFSTFTIDFENGNLCVPLLNPVTPLPVCLKVSGKKSDFTVTMVCATFCGRFSDNPIVASDSTSIKVCLNGPINEKCI